MKTKPKRLFWYMVLATIVLLVFLSTSPTTMDSKTIVVGSSTLQHALGVDQSDVRVKRHLRSLREKTENIDSDNEDRTRFTDYFQKELADEMFKKFVGNHDEINDDHVQAWSTAMEEAYLLWPNHYAAETAKISMIESYLFDGGSSAYVTKLLEHTHIGKLMADRQHRDVLEVLVANQEFPEFLKRPLLKFWIEQYSDTNLYRVILDFLLEHYNDVVLVEMLVAAKGYDETKQIATILESTQLALWQHFQVSGDAVFNRLQLDKDILQKRLWSTWVLYMFKLERTKAPRLRRNVAALVLSRVTNYDVMMKLIIRGENFEGTKEAAEMLKADASKLPKSAAKLPKAAAKLPKDDAAELLKLADAAELLEADAAKLP